jgi:homocysteine S-methyltransferase
MASTADLLNGDRRWIAWTGMETDLIFNKKWDLPGFAAFPLALSEEGRERVTRYYEHQVALARESGVGAILDSATWMANRDRAQPLGYDAAALSQANAEAVALAVAVRDRSPDVPVLVSGQIGPHGDAYQAGAKGSTEAQAYHSVQIEQLVAAGVDLVSAYALGSGEEASGIAQAAGAAGITAMISFTVETDGRLADGSPLSRAIGEVEAHTGDTVLGFCINCAHPDHIAPALDGGAWMSRLVGVIPNASRRSHAELDGATELDPGNPAELAEELGALRERYPQLSVFCAVAEPTFVTFG